VVIHHLLGAAWSRRRPAEDAGVLNILLFGLTWCTGRFVVVGGEQVVASYAVRAPPTVANDATVHRSQ